jgi:hypothetical protein
MAREFSNMRLTRHGQVMFGGNVLGGKADR